jgi:hypothetical protein
VFYSATSFRAYAHLTPLAAFREREQNRAEIRSDVDGINPVLAGTATWLVEVRIGPNTPQTAATDRPNHVGSEVLQDSTHVRVSDNCRQYEPDLVKQRSRGRAQDSTLDEVSWLAKPKLTTEPSQMG